jgi:hypothetical protein
MDSRNYNHGKFFSPMQIYMGYVFIAVGIFCAVYSLTILILIIPGTFMAFTSTGTIVDFKNRRVKPYTLHFGIIRTGNWIDTDQFTRFNIQKATRKYTAYSRGSVRFDMGISDLKLMLINKNGSRKVIINRYTGFEEAQKDKDELSVLLFPDWQNDNPGDHFTE